MRIMLFLISILLPTAGGYVLVGGKTALSRVERIVFSYFIGTGLLSFYVFYLILLNTPISILSLLPFFAFFLIIGFFRWRKKLNAFPLPQRPRLPGLSSGRKIVFWLLVVLVLWKLIFMVFLALSGPTVFNDAFTCWTYKAKVIYYTHTANMTSESEGVLQGRYNNYPLHLPIIRAWIAFCLGQWDDRFINLHSIILFLCLLCLVFEFLKKMTGALNAMIFTYVLSAIPVLIYNFSSGYADATVGCFFLASLIMLFYWNETAQMRYLFFSGILASVAMFTKNEGTAIVLPALLLTFLMHLVFMRQRSWKQVLGSIGLFIISLSLIVPWLMRSPALNSIAAVSGIDNAAVSFRPEGLGPLMNNLFVFRSHNLFWSGIIVLLVWKWRAALRHAARFFLMPSALALCATIYVFLFTPNVAWLIDGTTINRTLLIVIPVLALAGGLLFVPAGDSVVVVPHDRCTAVNEAGSGYR